MLKFQYTITGSVLKNYLDDDGEPIVETTPIRVKGYGLWKFRTNPTKNWKKICKQKIREEFFCDVNKHRLIVSVHQLDEEDSDLVDERMCDYVFKA